jgi:post-segregation antitoxin (ccd killing protein)
LAARGRRVRKDGAVRLFRMDEGDSFIEYEAHRFSDEHAEVVIEAWLERNSEYIVPDGGILVIGRQVTTNLGTTIDLLGVDRLGNVAVVELKRDKTPRDTLAQALEYASFAATLNGEQLESIYCQYTGDHSASLAEAHHGFFSLTDDEAVSFNKDQVIVVVGTEVVQPIRQSAAYLRQKGLRVVCLEFRYFQARSGERLLSTDAVVGGEPLGGSPIVSAALPKTTEAAFLAGCDDAGRAVFTSLLAMAKAEALPLNWGSRGFSLNVDAGGRRLCLVYGYPRPVSPGQSPQVLYTDFAGLARKLPDSADLVERTRARLLDVAGFAPAGAQREVKNRLEGTLGAADAEAIATIVREYADEVRRLAEAE